MGKKVFMKEVQLPKEVVTGGFGYIPSSKKIKYIGSQIFEKESDLERLIKRGINDFPWFKRFLENASMEKILRYAEQEIKKANTLTSKQKKELLSIIKNKGILI